MDSVLVPGGRTADLDVIDTRTHAVTTVAD
jgi:hypothetical protein